MRDKSPETQEILAPFRFGPCEICGRPGPTDAAHIFSVGAGEATFAANTIALCRYCHSRAHGGAIRRHVLLCVAGFREGTTPQAIEDEVHRIRRERSSG